MTSVREAYQRDWDLTLPQTLQTEGSMLQFHQCAPVGEVGHFQSPEARYSFSEIPTGFFTEVAILEPPAFHFYRQKRPGGTIESTAPPGLSLSALELVSLNRVRLAVTI